MVRRGLTTPVNRTTGSVALQNGDLVDLLRDVVSAHAPDATYRFVSAASLELMGYSPDELVGNSPYDYFHPDDLAQIEAAHRSALRSEPYTVAYRSRHKDGHYVWMETTGQVVEDGAGTVREILCSTRALEDRSQNAGNVHDLCLHRIERVLAVEALDIFLQPIVNLTTREVCAYEALSRFHGSDGPSPEVWFGEAWSVGRGIELEMLAVRKAVELLPSLPGQTGLSINVSPPTIAAPGFLRSFAGIEDRIRLEITEHLRVSDYVVLLDSLAPFRARGGQVAVDDFGAGYASLSHIINLRPDWVKLDIALVDRVDTDPIVQAVVTGVVSFARPANIRLVAEGIESQAQLSTLLDLGLQYGQGYFFGHPLPAEEALAKS
jgi:PAS domain S-box-containing protein